MLIIRCCRCDRIVTLIENSEVDVVDGEHALCEACYAVEEAE